jgi:predicted nucleic acid-binding protein
VVFASVREFKTKATRLLSSRDPEDDAYLSLSFAAHADFLVTVDKDMLSLSPDALRSAGLGFLSVVSPRGFLEQIGGE